MSDDSENLQRAAETRVRRRFDRETESLQKWHDHEASRDRLSQAQFLEESRARESAHEHAKGLELRAHERSWRENFSRLTPQATQVLTFDLSGAPSRHLSKDYAAMRKTYEAGRAGIAARHDENIAVCRAERAEKLREFHKVNTARETRHAEERLGLERRHEKTFDNQVKRERDRADQ